MATMIREIAGGILLLCVLVAGCVSEQPVAKGTTLELTSSPSGAEIYLDNQYRGTTPSTITDIEPGTHTLEYRLKDYVSWKKTITVNAGQASYFAALGAAGSSAPVPAEVVLVTTAPQASIAVKTSREQMIIGESIDFSGSCTGCDTIVLTIYGPGVYTNGVIIGDVKTSSLNSWTYTWSPGTKLLSGTYTVVASSSTGAVSDRKSFSVIGNGVVSVTPSSYAVNRGDTVTFSGQCSTGAKNVQLVMFGPGQIGSGITLGTFAVGGDNTWSYKYKLDNALPTGQYTVYVSDVPKTNTGSAQFTVGFAS
ncbi:MAG: PEGA domain-containing protein [Methanomicrobiales archaeon]|nr:PEGA domain-containing protein [Methanomicrobiales archaeon]